MIAKLTGQLDSVGDGWAIVDVGGVGYLVFCSGRTLAELGRPGEAVSLLIETNVREDHIHLYGFSGTNEREWFRLLQSVQSVGARVALGILGALSPDELSNGIAAQDRTTLTKAPGVGPKLADRIIAELKDKVSTVIPFPPTVAATAAALRGGGSTADAVSALVNLGYRQSEAFGAVAGATRELGEDASVESLIRVGLKELGQ